MSGFVALMLIGAAAFGALIPLGLPRSLWSFAGAAMFLGAAGYAWQGRPAQPAAPAVGRVDPEPVMPEAIALRDQLMGRFTADASYLIASDAMLRAGNRRAAAQVVLGGVRKMPRSFILWTQLGTVLTIHDGDQVSPAAEIAFRRAMQLAPEHPAPPYYAGLAYLRAGDGARARALIARAAAMSAPDTGYGRTIAAQLALLDRYLAATNEAVTPR